MEDRYFDECNACPEPFDITFNCWDLKYRLGCVEQKMRRESDAKGPTGIRPLLRSVLCWIGSWIDPESITLDRREGRIDILIETKQYYEKLLKEAARVRDGDLTEEERAIHCTDCEDTECANHPENQK